MPPWTSPNPIYDVVFKYLMQNQRVARLLIARITGLVVQSLTVSPQESAVRRTPETPEHDLPLTLLRMDFAARVQTRDGSERQVLIEIQKAKCTDRDRALSALPGPADRERGQYPHPPFGAAPRRCRS